MAATWSSVSILSSQERCLSESWMSLAIETRVFNSAQRRPAYPSAQFFLQATQQLYRRRRFRRPRLQEPVTKVTRDAVGNPFAFCNNTCFNVSRFKSASLELVTR